MLTKIKLLHIYFFLVTIITSAFCQDSSIAPSLYGNGRKYIISPSGEGIIKMRAISEQLEFELESSSKSEYTSLLVDKWGTYLVAAQLDGTISTWYITDRKRLASKKCHNKAPKGLTINMREGYVLSITDEGETHWLHYKTLEELDKTSLEHPIELLSANHQYIVGAYENKVFLYKRSKRSFYIYNHKTISFEASVASLSVGGENENLLAIKDKSGEISIINLEDGSIIRSTHFDYEGESLMSSFLSFIPGTDDIYVGSKSNISVFRGEDLFLANQISIADTLNLQSIDVSEDGRNIITRWSSTKGIVVHAENELASGRIIRSWDNGISKLPSEFRNSTKYKMVLPLEHEKEISAFTISSDGLRAVSADLSGVIKLWEVQTGNELASFQAKSTISTLHFDRNRNHIYSGHYNGEINVWFANSDLPILSRKSHSQAIKEIQVLGRIVFSASATELIQWNKKDMKKLKEIVAPINCFHVGKYLAAYVSKKDIVIVDNITLEERYRFESANRATAVQVNPLPEKSSNDQLIQLARSNPRYMELPPDKLEKLAISKKGWLLQTGHENGEINIWNNKGEVIHSFSCGLGRGPIEMLSPNNDQEPSDQFAINEVGNILFYRNNEKELKEEKYNFKKAQATGDIFGKGSFIICSVENNPRSLSVITSELNEVTSLPRVTTKISRYLIKDGFLIDPAGNTHSITNFGQLDSITESTNWVVSSADSQGYYYCSKSISRELHFSNGKTSAPFANYDVVFNRPDLVARDLGFSQKLTRVYQKVVKKRQDQTKIKLASISKNTPKILRLSKNIVRDAVNKSLNYKTENKSKAIHERLLSEYLEGFVFQASVMSGMTEEDAWKYFNQSLGQYIETTQNTVSINIEAESTGEYSNLTAFAEVNGVPLYGGEEKVVNDRSNKQVAILDIPLVEGKNDIEIFVKNELDISSNRKKIRYELKKSLEKNLYLLTIGVSSFNHSEMDLRYAAKDAQNLGKLFRRSNLYDSVIHMAFLDKRATKENILEVKEILRNSGVNDQVIIFVASHGLYDTELNYYLATNDTDFSDPGKKGLKYEELEDLVNDIPAREKVMLLDACFSGEVDKSEISFDGLSVKMDKVKGRGFRKIKSTNDLGLTPSIELMKALFNDLRETTGSQIISAASGVEFAYESPKWNNGVFTYALLEGLKSKSADQNDDGVVRVSELREYIFNRVTKLTDGKQHPTSRRENLENDFVVWKY